MASEILGLFGGKDPQQLQQDYLSGLMVSPAQMGNQSLLQQLISTGANAGAMMGYGGGRLLGGKVAGEVEASYIDEAVKAGNAVKGTPAQKMKAVADALAEKPGMGKQYLMALNEARRLEAEDLTMADAKFKAANRTRDRKETRMVMNPLTKQQEPKQFYWTEDLIDGVWVKATMPSDTPSPATTTETGLPPAQALQAEKDRRTKDKAAGGTSSTTTAPKTIESMTAQAEEKAQMDPLIAEADIERAGYNSAERQMQEQEKQDRALVAVDNLLPESIKYFEDGDAERILRDYYAYLTDEQKRELRKRIARSKIGKQRVRPKTDAPKGDISGSRLF